MEKDKQVLKPNGGYPMHTFQDVQDVFYEYIQNPKDRENIAKAYRFAEEKHRNQIRKSGEPYIHHLIEVAYILASYQAGPATLIAGLLHDVVEDTDVTVEDIKKMFGGDVANLVDSLTKIQRLKLSHRKAQDFEAEDHRKIFLGMARDIRVIIIKLADRLHNLRTLDALSEERQKAIAQETLDVFAPIAHRLGIFKLKSELEDLSLKYLEPEIYRDISSKLNQKVKNRAKSLNNLKKKIADIIFAANIPFNIEAREKSIYSIYRKIFKKGYHFDEIYDLLALRIITKTEINCYEILGLIHAVYTPLPGRFKDYIAMPKSNMYQSLHTTIVSGDGNIFEVQIRTEEMDEVAETGVAAHWRYKEGSNYNPKQEQKEIEEKLYWFRDFVSMSDEKNLDAKTYIDNLTKDIFEANVYVFTPQGKVIELPNGATPLDFAYKIHSRVGDQAIGALVNGVMVPLNTALKTGEVVEIKTSSSSPGPNEGWLKIAKTSSALSHIRKAIAKKNASLLKDERIAKGKQSLLEMFKERDVDEAKMQEMLNSSKVLEHFSFENVEDLYVAVANKTIAPSAVVDFLKLRKKPKIIFNKAFKGNSKSSVIISGAEGIAINLANCCSPIPGDNIVGYISKGKGITIHCVNCPNVAHDKKRLIEAKWNDEISDNLYPLDIVIEASDRPNLLVDIMAAFSQHKVPVNHLDARLHSETLTTTFKAEILVKDAHEYQDIHNVLLNVPSVYEVSRLIH